jgi:hypothetical protein
MANDNAGYDLMPLWKLDQFSQLPAYLCAHHKETAVKHTKSKALCHDLHISTGKSGIHIAFAGNNDYQRRSFEEKAV